MIAVLNVTGLIANLAGVILLFRYGMPYRVSVPEGDIVVAATRDPKDVRLDLVYKRFGWFGLALIVVGTMLQACSSIWGN